MITLQNLFRKSFVFVICIIPSMFLQAQTINVISETANKIEIKNLLYLKDSTAKLTVNEVLANGNKLFKDKNKQPEVIAEEDATYWIKFDLTNQNKKNQSWILNFEFWVYVDLYVIKSGKVVEAKRTGHFVPFKKRDFPQANNNFIQLMIEPSSTISCLVKLKTSTSYIAFPTSLNTKVQSTQLLDKQANNTLQNIYLFLGVYLVLFFYNLFVFISTKEKKYIYYLALLVMLVLALWHNFGYTVQFLKNIDGYSKIHGDIDVVMSAVFGTFIILFTKSFLNVQQRFKMLNKVFWGIIIFLGISVILTFITQTYTAYNISSLLGLVTMATVLTAAIQAVRKKIPSAGYFLVAYIFFIAGVVFLLLGALGVLAPSYLTFYSMQIGSSIESVLFSFALANQINNLKRENEKKQARIIEQLKENEALQEKVNRELEEKVRERTQEIQEQKEEIQQQNEELVQMNDQISEQRDMLAEYTQNINDSINYAKRIQQALLPPREVFSQYFKEHVLFYRAQNIVSGDFYFVKKSNNQVLIALGDCTGHGVPGAFMSIMATSLLNEIVSEERMFDKTGKILEVLRDKIKSQLKQTKNSKQKDGMDMALCLLDFEANSLTYSGAFNPLYILREGKFDFSEDDTSIRLLNKDTFNLLELRANRQPVGIHVKETPFDTKTIDIKTGDLIYLLSDGYVDQFGGENKEKFKSKRFKHKLLDIGKMPLIEQQRILEEDFDAWKGALKQIDDVSIVGFKV